jgi:RHS repeat-associated protein
MNIRIPNMKKANILNLLLLTTSEQNTQSENFADLYLSLLHYFFLLNDTSKPQNSCVQKTPQLNAPQGNIYMGARYLDPKYSRWISVDPALGEYIPGAGKANARDAGGLPGMGGIFNSVNGNLYHYAGNNPVRYVDPDGRNEEDIVREWLFNAVKFISDNAESDEEKLLAAKLVYMMNNRKIQLDNIQERYCRNDFPKNSATKRAFFDCYLNTETKQPRNIIVIDIHNIFEGGFEDFISTLAHEGWHAVQNDLGLFCVDINNNINIKTYKEFTDIELPAYNMGVTMYNKYASKNNMPKLYPYTWGEINEILHKTNK